MPWVKATDAVTDLPMQLNLDRARTMCGRLTGTDVAYAADSVVTVKEAPDTLAAMSRGCWLNVSPVGGDDPDWLNLDTAETIVSTAEGSLVMFDEAHSLAIMEPVDMLLQLRTRRPRRR